MLFESIKQHTSGKRARRRACHCMSTSGIRLKQSLWALTQLQDEGRYRVLPITRTKTPIHISCASHQACQIVRVSAEIRSSISQ